MRHIGIDMAKDDFQAFIPELEINTKYENNKKGFKKLLKMLNKDDVLGVESTSNYHHHFALFFMENGFEVREINPIVTKQRIRCTIRKKKTDKTDAVLISQIIAIGEGHKMTKVSLMNGLKKLTRTRKYLVSMRSDLKRKIKSLEKDVCDTNILQKTLKQSIKHFDKQVEKLEKEIKKYSDTDTETIILQSIPGISTILSASIKAEISDIKKFSNAKKLVAFAGLDPKINQSGASLNNTGKLTKRGSSTLRYSLFLAARANICSNTVFTNYYLKLRNKGKSYTQAVCATSRKMLEIIYFLLSREELFDRNFCQD